MYDRPPQSKDLHFLWINISHFVAFSHFQCFPHFQSQDINVTPETRLKLLLGEKYTLIPNYIEHMKDR